MGSGWGSRRTLDHSRGQCASTFGRYRFVFNYTKFPDFILSYQRHKMPARSDENKTHVGSQHRKFQWAWESAASSSESCQRPPVRRPLSQPEAEQAWGCPHRRPVPGSGPRGLSVGCPAASASNSESLSFCRGPCSAEGEGSVRAWVETGASPSSRLPPRRLRGQAPEAPPFTLTPLPHAVGRKVHTAAQPKL